VKELKLVICNLNLINVKYFNDAGVFLEKLKLVI
jgi:hypothetical protein